MACLVDGGRGRRRRRRRRRRSGKARGRGWRDACNDLAVRAAGLEAA